MEPLVSLKFVNKDVFFRGLWGFGSTTFLGMCAHFSSALQGAVQSVSRTHILYMLATMYDGRQKSYSAITSSAGLVGILGSISVLALPLLSPSDNPEEIARFAVIDLPVIDLMSDSHELYSHQYSSIDFTHAAAPPRQIEPHGSHRNWSVHAKEGKIFGEASNDVMMAARCDGRLVGWFGPLAADFTFLSSCYQDPRHTNDEHYEENFVFNGFDIVDEDWQKCQVQRPLQQDLNDQIGLTHSRGSSMLRYAATGFFANAGEEIAIATDDIEAAFGRVDAQGAGIVIA